MADPDDQHYKPVVLDLVEDPKFADSRSPDVSGSAELDGIGPGIFGQLVNPTGNPSSDGRLQLRQHLRRRWNELDGVHR
jgi:hypothetical protein